MLKIECIINGILDENCFIIHNNDSALIVDPGSEEDKIFNFIDNLGLKVEGILITHYHFDHVLVLDKIKEKYKVKIFDYNSKQNYSFDCFNFKIIRNYGHTMDSVSFYFESEKIMFTGDFIFKGSIGKYDYENERTMYESLKSFVKFDDSVIIYPGHGPSSSVGYEKKHNYFLRGL